MLAAAAVLLLGTAAHAAWPERQVTIVVPFAAGGITDILARLTAERLQAAFKQPFIIENQVGAAGVIAADRVVKSAPDGYTLFFTPIFQITMAPFTNTVSFDPQKDFKPIAAVGATPFAITVSGSFPANTLAEFIAHVKAQPGKVPFASAGTGSLTHVSSAVFLEERGARHDPRDVSRHGSGVQRSARRPRRDAFGVAGRDQAVPGIQAREAARRHQRLQRSPQLPDVPTIAETVKGAPPVVTYNGLLAPGKTPQAIVDALSKELIAAEKSAEFREKLTRVGVEPVANTPEQFAKIIADDTERWRDIVRDLNLKPQ